MDHDSGFHGFEMDFCAPDLELFSLYSSNRNLAAFPPISFKGYHIPLTTDIQL